MGELQRLNPDQFPLPSLGAEHYPQLFPQLLPGAETGHQ
jgi:hypothetical protein